MYKSIFIFMYIKSYLCYIYVFILVHIYCINIYYIYILHFSFIGTGTPIIFFLFVHRPDVFIYVVFFLFLSRSGGLLLCDFKFLNYVIFSVIQDSFTFKSNNFMSGC